MEIVDQERTQAPGFFGQQTGSAAVDRRSNPGLALGPVHRGVGGGIDDYLGLVGANQGAHLACVCQVDLWEIERSHVRHGSQGAAQLPAQLSEFS